MLVAGGGGRPRLLLEMFDKRRRNEACARSVKMFVAPRCLPMRIEALGNDKHQLILGAGHCNVQQPPFLLDILGAPCRQIGGDAAIDSIEDEDALPLLSFG